MQNIKVHRPIFYKRVILTPTLALFHSLKQILSASFILILHNHVLNHQKSIVMNMTC